MLPWILILSLVTSPILEQDYARSLDVRSESSQRGGSLEKAREFGDDVEAGRLRERTDQAINSILIEAYATLKENGHNFEADQIINEWKGTYKGFLLGMRRDVGDHEGIQWLITVHERIHTALGDKLCRMTRLHDLYTIAYCLPMVLSCAGESQATVDALEYSKHFIPLMGVVSYWVSWGICLAASSGMVFICGLVGEAVECLVVTFVAPRLSPKLYPKSCVP